MEEMKVKQSANGLSFFFAAYVLVIVLFMINGITVKADYEKKEPGYVFENGGIQYRVLTRATDSDLGTVEAIGLTRPLTTVRLYETVYETDNYAEYFEIVSIAPEAFAGKRSIREFTLDEDSFVNVVPDECLSGCTNLKKVFLLNSNLKRIGKNAFKGCKKLKFFRIETRKLKKNSIGKNAFKGIAKGMIVVTPNRKERRYLDYFKKRGAKSLQYGKTKKGSWLYSIEK